MEKALLSFFFVFLPYVTIHAQTIDSASSITHLADSTSNSKMKSYENSTMEIPSKLLSRNKSNSFLKSSMSLTKKKKKMEFHGKIFNDNNYTYNNAIPGQYNGIYMRTGVNFSTKILGIPISGGLKLATQNNQVRLDYSYASMQFDMPQYKSQLKDKYLNYISDVNHFYPPGEADAVSKISDTINRMQDCEKVLSDHSYDKIIAILIKQAKKLEDSIKIQLRDSCEIDSCQTDYYKSINDSITKMQRYAQDYKLAEQYINSHQQDLKKYTNYQNFLKEVKNASDITDIPRASEDLKTKNILDKKESVLSGIQKFAIGKVNLNYSPFTLYNQNIYGINIEYLIHSLIFVGGGIGIPSAFNMGFSPQFFTQLSSTVGGINRCLGFMRLGIGKVKGNHLHLIYYTYNQKFNNVGTYSLNMPPANSVLSLDFLQLIGKDIKISSEAAISNSSYLYRSASFIPIGRDDSSHSVILNYAFRTALDGKIKKTSTTFGAKFQIVSNNFITTGDPYLRRAYEETSINCLQEIFEKKISLSDILTHSIAGYQQPGNTFQLVNNNFTINYKPGTVANYTGSYVVMKETPLGSNENPNDFLSHTFNFIQQYTAKIKKIRAITAITSVVMHTKNQSPELSSNNTSIQNGLKESFIFKNGITFQTGFGIILSNYGAALNSSNFWHTGYWVESGNSFSIKKKITIQYTARYTIDKILGNNLNLNSTVSIKIYKTLQLNARCQIMIFNGVTAVTNNQTTNAGGGLTYSW